MVRRKRLANGLSKPFQKAGLTLRYSRHTRLDMPHPLRRASRLFINIDEIRHTVGWSQNSAMFEILQLLIVTNG